MRQPAARPRRLRAVPGEANPAAPEDRCHAGVRRRPGAADERQERALWWYRMCEHAGLVDKGQRSGLNLHRARHGFALEMRRAASLEAASQALGHSDLSTAMRHYGHWADDELAAAFDALAAARKRR